MPLSILDSAEYIAIAASLGYVITSARQHSGTWLLGFVGSILYMAVFFYSGLYGSALVSCLFTGLMVYGWLQWRRGKGEPPLIVSRLSPKQRWLALACGVALSPCVYVFCAQIMGSPFPPIDAAIAGLSIVAQALVARKKFEAWYGWVAINIMAVYTYASSGLTATALLYVAYTVLAVYGLREWRNSMLKPAPHTAACCE